MTAQTKAPKLKPKRVREYLWNPNNFYSDDDLYLMCGVERGYDDVEYDGRMFCDGVAEVSTLGFCESRIGQKHLQSNNPKKERGMKYIVVAVIAALALTGHAGESKQVQRVERLAVGQRVDLGAGQTVERVE
ncbi:hypothetical protein [Candidatus Burkholderia verschuerenii]|uniref:hypothetical protein n=1 Tax=Candidatus Burkholderia verschuerenii TaxID=242163 RepID=UPI00067CBA5A|nr:hypothetical protein [Candidatus Burkholderia verschuerenii]